MDEEKKKICPMPLMNEGCKQKDCQWWNEDEKDCAVVMISVFLGNIWSSGLPKSDSEKEGRIK